MKHFFQRKTVYTVLLYCVLLVVVSWFAWSGVLSFWFFKAFEPSWLMGVPHTFGGLYRSHAYLYFLDYTLFGWNPAGWYATALVLHTLASLLIFGYLYSLTKSFRLAGLAGLFFVASPSYQDVLTWGSFNSYYALLLSCVVASLWLYHYWRCSLKKRFLFGSLFFAFLAFFIRESALALIGVIIFAELTIYYRTKIFKPFEVLKKIIPFIGVALIYILLRYFLGEVYGDYMDDSVQLRLSLLQDHLYLMFAWRVILAFGRHFASLWIPYEWLNTVRVLLVDISRGSVILNKYFFSLMGGIVAGICGGILYKLRKTKIFSFLLFAFMWSLLWTVITAYAIPSSDTVLTQDFFWNTRRYNYYAYVGVVLWWSVIFWWIYENIQRRLPRLRYYTYPGFVGLIGFVVIINIFWLRAIEKNLFVSIHAQSRAFYASFQKEFPKISKDYIIYQYPYSEGLNDYLFEWSFLKGTLYPNLKDAPFTTESQLARILEKVSNGVYRLDNILFVGYNSLNGIRNETKRAKEALRNVQSFEAYGVETSTLPEGKFPVEIPYIVEIGYNAVPSGVVQATAEAQSYAADRDTFLTHASVDVSATVTQRPNEPFLHVLPMNLIDGNFGPRSGWLADSIPGVVTIDLGSEQEVGALWWSSGDKQRVPSTYRIESSLDGKAWKEIVFVHRNTKTARIDFFDEPVTGRFIRMDIGTTDTGISVYLDEIEVIGAGGLPFAKRYTDPNILVNDSAMIIASPTGWAKFSWSTNKTWTSTPPQEKWFSVITDGSSHTVQFILPDMERFSTKGEFLQKFITGITVAPVSPFQLNIEYVTLKPQYEIAATK